MEQTAQRNRAERFFSEDGHRAYASSGTTGEKTRYFFEYLRGLGQKTPDRVLYKLAYIMADSMDAAGGRFAGGPAILQDSVNPFIKLVVGGTLQPAEEMERSLSTGWEFFRSVTKQEEDGCRWWITDRLLCALHGISPVRRVAYEELQDSSAEDCDLYLYRIERQIIWLVGGDALMSPYSLQALFCEPFREQQADLGYLHDDLLRGNLQFAAEKNGGITAKTRRDTPDKQQMSAGRVIVTLLLVLLACFAIGKALSIYAVNSAPEPDMGNGWDCLRAMLDASENPREKVSERFTYQGEGTLDGAPCDIWKSARSPFYYYCVTRDAPRQVWEIQPNVSSTMLWSE